MNELDELDGLRGKALGDAYVRRAKAYLSRATELPMQNGSVNVTALAEAAGVPTQSVYKNSHIRQALEDARKRLGLPSWSENKASPSPTDSPDVTRRSDSDGKVSRLEKRLSDLEQKYSAAMAENYELRQQLKDLRLQLARDDMMIESGRRIAAPTDE